MNVAWAGVHCSSASFLTPAHPRALELAVTAHPAMDRRGRSRDVSPIALARKANEDAVRARTGALTYTPSHYPPYLSVRDASLPYRPRKRGSPDNMATPAYPVASSSRLPPIPSSAIYLPLPDTAGSPPSRTHSSSTVASLSPEPTPLGPLTPPDLSDPYHKPYHSPSTATLDYFDRPPSPPRSLRDRMQVAYALEDMHLAKVLYLKLQGVEVTGDDDPRIAAVQDEDFSTSFVPCGKLELDESVARRCREEEKRERERRRRAQREARLRACERIWEANAAWVREENAKVARRKEEEARHRRRMSTEAREREREREREARERELETLRRTRQVRFSALTQRPLLDYSTLSHERSSQPRSPSRSPKETLQLSFMPCNIPRHSPPSVRSLSPPDHNSLTLQRLQHEFAQSLNRTVRFAEVVTSMHGPLFPNDESPALRLQAKMNRSQRELLDSLFESDIGADERVSAKGNARGNGRSKRASMQAEHSGQVCVACSQGTRSSSSMPGSGSAISSSVSTITRSNSWFSFGSRSSASTALTTPSSSLLSSKSPSQSLSPISPSSVLSAEPESIRHSCHHCPLVRIPTTEDPLRPAAAVPQGSEVGAEDSIPSRGRARTRGSGRLSSIPEIQSLENGLVKRVGRSVSTLMDMAAQFQRAYVKATMFSVGTDLPRSRSDSRGSSGSRSPPRSPWRTRRASASAPLPPGRPGKLRPEGYRALAFDVHLLLSSSPDEEMSGAMHPTRTLIPLALRLPGAESSLPCHGRVFPAPTQPPRSPFRVAQPGAPSHPRLRPVANPVLLRLQALQNICAVRALAWEGRAQEGRMCAGKEKLVGVAWEGIGRSSLGWEVTAVVC